MGLLLHTQFERLKRHIPWHWRNATPLDNVRIRTTRETLARCAAFMASQKGGAYLRFGDGDVYLAHGTDDALQTSTPDFTREMREAFRCNMPGVLKALPIHSARFGHEEGMSPGVFLMRDAAAERFLRRTLECFTGHPIYSAVALHYQFSADFEYTLEFLKLLKRNAALFVGAEDVPEADRSLLFGNAPHVRTPMKDSYRAMDRIEQEAARHLASRENYGVVVVATGCAGRVLIKRLLHRGLTRFFYFDFGSLLDILCGWNTRTWHSRADVTPEKIERLRRELA
ncbi:hypothetical protein [Nitratidesulfovibrio termitidis]|uniref:hypothetical protein n=1 Tax=Nitratidesulfovibrio termitidis TaxID=42252 RepID=UPI0012ECA27F|nr:hypothetical protein [Nitratidesulfovibrio termitidis]